MMYALRAASFLRNPAHPKCVAAVLQKRFVRLDPVSATASVATETFEEKNERLQRPLSPHLTIYKPQMTSMLSITHRITGLVVYGYIIAFGVACRVYPVSDLINMINSLELSPATWTACKAVFIYPYCYHLCNGFRHLVWDAGLGLTLKSVYATGYAVIVLSILLSFRIATYFK